MEKERMEEAGMGWEQMSWEKELDVSPHGSRGFSSQLQHNIMLKVKAVKPSPLARRAGVAAAVLALPLILLMQWSFPAIKDFVGAPSHYFNREESSSKIAAPDTLRLLQPILSELIERHGFPQTGDDFQEINDGNAPGRLYSEITVGEAGIGGAAATAKVTYRITVAPSEEGEEYSHMVELVKDWNTVIEGQSVVSRWQYGINGEAARLLAEDDQDGRISSFIMNGQGE